MIKKLLVFFFVVIVVISCKKSVREEKEIYSNNFETNNLQGISNGIITQFNGSAVLGQYNNNSYSLTLTDLPKHDLVTISFDLYIHDSWNGDKLAPNGPDVWQMLVDDNIYINTTFSNEQCGVGVFCPPQAYPSDYPNSNHNPRAGAYQTNLPGACSMKNSPDGSSMYKIEKTFTHSKNTLLLRCLDKLVQTDVVDPKCDESWSVDNIRIKTVTL